MSNATKSFCKCCLDMIYDYLRNSKNILTLILMCHQVFQSLSPSCPTCSSPSCRHLTRTRYWLPKEVEHYRFSNICQS